MQEDLGQPCDVLKFGVEVAWFFAQLCDVTKVVIIHEKIYVNFLFWNLVYYFNGFETM